MNSNLRIQLAVVFTALLVGALPALADGVLLSWSPNTIEGLTETKFNDAKEWASERIVQKNLEATSWCDAYLLLVAASNHADDTALLRSLAEQTSTVSKPALVGTSRLIIWERIASGEIIFEGKGLHVEDDLFTVAGRANWLLRNITKANYGIVTPRSSQEEIAAIRSKWLERLAGASPQEFVSPYSVTKGVPELAQPAAIEAMIVSLAPNPIKDQLTRRCLKTIYKLTELPEEKDNPARLCNPDTYTFSWLGAITGITDEMSAEQWNAWWQKNKGTLRWNGEKEIFEP